eukprot:gene64-4313_t
MKILLPDNIDFEVKLESDEKITSKVLVFDSQHYLLNILEKESGHNIFTEKWSLEEKKWILRRHISLENQPEENYHYYVFLVCSRFLDGNCKLVVQDKELEIVLKKKTTYLVGLMYRTKERCEMNLNSDLEFIYDYSRPKLDILVKFIHEKMHIGSKFYFISKNSVDVHSLAHVKKLKLPKDIPVEIPHNISELSVELDWNLVGRNFSIRPTALIFDQDGKLTETIDINNPNGVVKPDEILNKYGIALENNSFDLNFEILSPEVVFIIFTTSISIYTKNMSYLRVMDSTMKVKHKKSTLTTIQLSKSTLKTMIWSMFYQTRNGWFLMNLDIPSNGTTNQDLLPTIKDDILEPLDKEVLLKYSNKTLEQLIVQEESNNFRHFEKMKFFYKGKSTTDYMPVYYLILNRLDESLISDPEKLIVFIYEMLKEDIELPYVLVVDSSFEKFTRNKYSFHSIVKDVLYLFKPHHIKNCRKLLLVQPYAYGMKLVEELISLVKPRMNSKSIIKVLENWEDLKNEIDVSKLGIPSISKRFQTISYNVKLKFSGSKQWKNFNLKMTLNSILIINVEYNRVYFEIFYSNIEAVCCRDSVSEIYVQFKKSDDLRLISYGGTDKMDYKSSSQVTSFRILFENEQVRDIIADSIYDHSINSRGLIVDSTHQVNKKKNIKTHNFIKVTTDSVLYFKVHQMNLEIPFTQILSIKRSNEDNIIIKYRQKGMDQSLTLTADLPKELEYSIEDGMLRFQHFIDEELTMFKVYKQDLLLADFFESAVKNRIKEDENSQWKKIYYFEAIISDLEKLFNRFEPHESHKAHLTFESMENVLRQLKLKLEPDDIFHLVKIFDHKKDKILGLNDLLIEYVYYRKEKDVVEKKKVISMKMASPQISSPKTKNLSNETVRFKMSPRMTNLEKKQKDEDKTKLYDELKRKAEIEKIKREEERLKKEQAEKELNELIAEVESRLLKKERERKKKEDEEKIRMEEELIKKKQQEEQEEMLKKQEIEEKTAIRNQLKLDLTKTQENQEPRSPSPLQSPKTKDLIKMFSLLSPRTKISAIEKLEDNLEDDTAKEHKNETISAWGATRIKVELSELKKNILEKNDDQIAPWQRELKSKKQNSSK